MGVAALVVLSTRSRFGLVCYGVRRLDGPLGVLSLVYCVCLRAASKKRLHRFDLAGHHLSFETN